MPVSRLQKALAALAAAITETSAALDEMRAEHDPLASHIFTARRQYRDTHDTKSGKRREVNARLSYTKACELGFRGSGGDWESLLGGVAKR